MSRTLRTTWPTLRTRMLMVLDDTSLRQARVASASDDDVVVHVQLEQPRALDQLTRETDVFAARRRVAARMVVQQDDRGGRLEDGGLENLARVHQAGRQRAFRDDHVAQQPVLRVE